ncbi:MAG: arsenate reductase (glutaredoxin) [Bacteroidia bacterium]
MITIYHNNRCTKSRCALELIESKTKDFKVIEYLKTPPPEKELKGILKKLGMKAEQIIRKKEPLFKEKFEGKKFTQDQWIKILVKNPILIERPIVVKGNKAVIGRPTENVMALL